MHRITSLLPALGLFLFATFPASSHFSLNSYGISSGGTNSSQDGTYTLQGDAGEQTNGTGTDSSGNVGGSGQIQTEQINVPGAPTLSNSSGSLNCIVTTTNEPTDATYAIRVSTSSSFTSPQYVQASGALGANPVFQSYGSPGVAWGGASGILISSLTPNTTYYVDISAMEGQFTNTNYGAYASATVSPYITFSVSPSSYSLGSFLPNTIVTSTNLSFTYATNALSGGEVYVKGQYGGFHSTAQSTTITSYTGNLSSTTSGIGIQASSPTQTSGGPLTTVSPFNGTGNTVGGETTSLVPMLATTAPIVGGSANADVQVKAAPTTPPSNDYNEVFTFVAAANF